MRRVAFNLSTLKKAQKEKNPKGQKGTEGKNLDY
jgi:hypothetical protein